MLIFFFHDTATTEIYTLSLHDALPIFLSSWKGCRPSGPSSRPIPLALTPPNGAKGSLTYPLTPIVPVRTFLANERSEEHTSELQSQFHLVCRLLLEKKKKHNILIVDVY